MLRASRAHSQLVYAQILVNNQDIRYSVSTCARVCARRLMISARTQTASAFCIPLRNAEIRRGTSKTEWSMPLVAVRKNDYQLRKLCKFTLIQWLNIV